MIEILLKVWTSGGIPDCFSHEFEGYLQVLFKGATFV